MNSVDQGIDTLSRFGGAKKPVDILVVGLEHVKSSEIRNNIETTLKYMLAKAEKLPCELGKIVKTDTVIDKDPTKVYEIHYLVVSNVKFPLTADEVSDIANKYGIAKMFWKPEKATYSFMYLTKKIPTVPKSILAEEIPPDWYEFVSGIEPMQGANVNRELLRSEINWMKEIAAGLCCYFNCDQNIKIEYRNLRVTPTGARIVEATFYKLYHTIDCLLAIDHLPQLEMFDPNMQGIVVKRVAQGKRTGDTVTLSELKRFRLTTDEE